MIPAFAPNAPAFTPSLNLDFTTGILDPRITFTRASTATYTGSDGLIKTAAINTPRFDYNPTTLQPNGLLIEEQRTNLLTYSEQFNNAAWAKQSTTISANTIVAPDGTLTGDKLVETASTAGHSVFQSLTTTASSYAFSVYAKAGERSYMILYNITGVVGQCFNLSNGTLGVTQGTVVSTITPVGNGWYRCTMTGTATAASNSFRIYMDTTNSMSGVYTGDGVSGIYIWGAQLEAGAFPTSYIPTVASQVTRSADAASMTGSNFSSWYRADEGTIYSEGAQLTPSSSYFGTFSISDGSNTNRLYHEYGPTSQLYVVASNTISADIDCGNTSQGVFAKLATAYKTNDFAAVLNGGTVFTDALGNIPTVNKVNIGGDAGGVVNYSGTIKRIAYYPKRLSNSQLRAITS